MEHPHPAIDRRIEKGVYLLRWTMIALKAGVVTGRHCGCVHVVGRKEKEWPAYSEIPPSDSDIVVDTHLG